MGITRDSKGNEYYLGIDIPCKDDAEWRFWVLLEDTNITWDIPVEDKEYIKNKVIEYCLAHGYSYNGKYFDMKKITEEMILVAMDNGWTREDAERGYAIFTSNYGNGAEHIQKIDYMDVFEDDEEAAKQAEKDGIKLIHDMKFDDENTAAYIDTPENRELLKDLAIQNEVCTDDFKSGENKMIICYEKEKEIDFKDLKDKECFFSNGVLYMKIFSQDLREYNISCVNAISIVNAGLTKFDNDESVIKAKRIISK